MHFLKLTQLYCFTFILVIICWAMKKCVLLHFRSLTDCLRLCTINWHWLALYEKDRFLTCFTMLENLFCSLLYHKGQGTTGINSLNWKTEFFELSRKKVTYTTWNYHQGTCNNIWVYTFCIRNEYEEKNVWRKNNILSAAQ